MDELVNVMRAMLSEIIEMNGRLKEIEDSLFSISGCNVYSLSDVCDKIDSIETAISSLETTISLNNL